MDKIKPLFKSKTFWTCAVAILTACGAYATGDINGVEFVKACFEAFALIFLRQGMVK